MGEAPRSGGEVSEKQTAKGKTKNPLFALNYLCLHLGGTLAACLVQRGTAVGSSTRRMRVGVLTIAVEGESEIIKQYMPSSCAVSFRLLRSHLPLGGRLLNEVVFANEALLRNI